MSADDLCPTCGAAGVRGCATPDGADHPGRPTTIPDQLARLEDWRARLEDWRARQ